MVTELMGAAKEFSFIGQGMIDTFSWEGSELHLPLPMEVMEKHRATRVGKDPTPWPEVFHAKVKAAVDGKSLLIHTYYDYTDSRWMNIIIPPVPQGVVRLLVSDVERRPENYGQSMKRTIKAFEQGQDKNGVVDTLNGNTFFPDTAVWMLLEPYTVATFSRSVPFCETRMAPKNVIPPPDVMSGAKYVGQEEVDGVNCDVYSKGSGPAPFDNKAFVTLYENAETGYPVKFVLFNGVEMLIEQFDPNGTLDNADWELPPYCSKAATPSFPVPIDQ